MLSIWPQRRDLTSEFAPRAFRWSFVGKRPQRSLHRNNAVLGMVLAHIPFAKLSGVPWGQIVSRMFSNEGPVPAPHHSIWPLLPHWFIAFLWSQAALSLYLWSIDNSDLPLAYFWLNQQVQMPWVFHNWWVRWTIATSCCVAKSFRSISPSCCASVILFQVIFLWLPQINQ